ncbi:hypothetical protein C7Y66_22820 [Chroococcidiopsis sp. CCALA 051]|nr:hypothetical protein C7Y66_22820 [Chroococcidiopsis sp. CCALA 051]
MALWGAIAYDLSTERKKAKSNSNRIQILTVLKFKASTEILEPLHHKYSYLSQKILAPIPKNFF